MTVVGVVAMTLAIADSRNATIPGHSVWVFGAFGFLLAVLGVALSRRPYPRYALRALIGAVLLPIAVVWLMTGVRHTVEAFDFWARTDEPAFVGDQAGSHLTGMPNSRKVSDEFAREYGEMAARDLLLGSLVFAGAMAATWSSGGKRYERKPTNAPLAVRHPDARSAQNDA